MKPGSLEKCATVMQCSDYRFEIQIKAPVRTQNGGLWMRNWNNVCPRSVAEFRLFFFYFFCIFLSKKNTDIMRCRTHPL